MTIDAILATKLIAPGMTRTAIAQIRRKLSTKGRDSRDAEEEKSKDEVVYQESLALMRNLLDFVCHTAIEDLHPLTELHTPPPPSIYSKEVEVPNDFYNQAADLVQRQLGPNLDKVGKTWWQWRKAGSTVKAHWVEMKVDFDDRMARGDPGKKVIFYVHGGAYYMGGIGHDVQVQRHARKLKGRCFAPRYRLAPTFPFPCAIQDILTAYLYLLTQVDPTHVVIAGDSAGGGLCLALLQICRDQGVPMPAGASLISPWVDLLHSFPSITAPTDYDYIPQTGFHAKHTLAWPPPTADEMEELGIERNKALGPDYVIEMDGKPYVIKDQINMYAQNLELVFPLVSAVHAATLGGFCPCQVIVGGGERLRDEQLYLAHKMANPTDFPLIPLLVELNGENPEDMHKFPPTDVQLLVFDDGPHAAPTLGHIDVSKHEYRAVSQFAAWALAKAQNTEIEIEDFTDDLAAAPTEQTYGQNGLEHSANLRAGMPVPPFQDHMVRYRVDRAGKLYPLEPPSMIPALNIPADQIGLPKGDTLKGWLGYKQKLDHKFASEKKKVYEKRKANVKKGYIKLPNGEIPPPSALVGRRVIGEADEMDGPPTGLTNSIVGKLFRTVESGGPSAKQGKNGSEDINGNLSAKRRSMIVRPDSISPPAYQSSSTMIAEM